MAESGEVPMRNRSSSSREGKQEVESTVGVLTRVDWDLTYSSEKLVNLDVHLVHILAPDNTFDATMGTENSYILAIAIGKALKFDLLSGILDSEIYPIREKLHNSEEYLMKFREHILEMKAQSAKFQVAFSVFRLENWKDDKATELPTNEQSSKTNANTKRQTAEKQKKCPEYVGEVSSKRIIDMQKKISALQQNEEKLKLKLHCIEQLSFRMEEAAEVVRGTMYSNNEYPTSAFGFTSNVRRFHCPFYLRNNLLNEKERSAHCTHKRSEVREQDIPNFKAKITTCTIFHILLSLI
ncbi:hypothetical protein SADUNF_Sadunf08G0091800 [Salix dunnii]|uniref:WIT1/2 N-terminal helical bundle domain-containing protein n=1 Tax=Salix dunnii TaxID=1413687 RepID=A0A835JTR7_9ROSI|nr:hypothetical protein SADUNF_Sadunf08G0091800 [Salix dunnii]